MNLYNQLAMIERQCRERHLDETATAQLMRLCIYGCFENFPGRQQHLPERDQVLSSARGINPSDPA